MTAALNTRPQTVCTVPVIRPRYLGLSEAEFLALSCGRHTHRLTPDWLPLLCHLRQAGGLRSITANAGAVLEQPWSVRETGTVGNTLRLYGPQQELEFHFDYWHCGFAVAPGSDERPAAALRFFDQRGDLLHSIEAEHTALLGRAAILPFHSGDQRREQRLAPLPAPASPQAPTPLDHECLRLWWQLPLDFPAGPIPGLPAASRNRLLAALGTAHARLVQPDAFLTLLDCIDALDRESLRLTVVNHGVVQRYRGRGFYASRQGGSLRLRNEECSLTLTAAAIAGNWLVRKPTRCGDCLALELHDASGALLAAIDAPARQGTAWSTLLGAMEEEAAVL